MRVLTFQRFHPRKIDETTEKNTLFAPSFFQKIIVFLSHFPPKCDTCDSKKSTSLLEGARCAYTREGFAFSSHLAFHLRLGGCLVILSFGVLLIGENIKMEFFENILSLFRDFFTLWGDISPYTYRGAPSNGASQDLFNLYGESHLIPTTDVLYDFSHLFFLFRRVPVAV